MKVYVMRYESGFGGELVRVRTRHWFGLEYCVQQFRSVTNISRLEMPYDQEIALDVRESDRDPDFWAIRIMQWIEFHNERPWLYYDQSMGRWYTGNRYQYGPDFLARTSAQSMRPILGEFENYECAPFRVRVLRGNR